MKKDLTNVVGYIYKLTSPNGKIYIGQTINKKQRKYHYKSGNYKQQIKLWNNVQKYNWKPFESFQIIEEILCGPDKQFLNEREKYWIKFYDSHKKGLNCNEGGSGNVGYIFSDESKLKMSNYHKNKPPMSNETKELLRKINLGDKNPMFGKKHSDEIKVKISEKLTGKKLSLETKEKIKNANIGKKMLEETKQKLREINLGKKYETKPIIQIDIYDNEIKEWEGISICAKELNLNISGISKVLTGISKTTKGYRFKYKND
jgi:group I intron endonuclease